MDFSIEEDVKVKLVLNWLKSLGFQEDELRCEMSFRFRYGIATYKIETGEQVQKGSARLDLLITRNGTNLFVVEVKNESVNIDESDIEQATSYARLVHPVAPFSLVTNGKEFYLYDSLTRKEMAPKDFAIKDRYEVALTSELRYEALKFFLGYSKENVLSFCEQQVSDHMKTLIGSADDPDKRFIPTLYSQRDEARQKTLTFLSSGPGILPIIGDSGTGKTCFMCAMARELVAHHQPVLFYRAIEFVSDVFHAVASDFNWELSSAYSEIQIIKRISDLFAVEGVSIFIDAIDEWEAPNRIALLDEFVRCIGMENIKLVISCKTSVWHDFLVRRETPTNLAESMKCKNQQGYELGTMTGREFHDAIANYRAFYQFHGLFEDRALGECTRNLHLLRIFFQVAGQLNLQFISFSSIEALRKYYDHVLAMTGERERASAILHGIAKELLLRGSDTIGLVEARQVLGLSANEIILPSLFEYSIFESHASERLSFYSEMLRNYVIAYHVLKLNEKPVTELSAALEEYRGNVVFEEALKLFYRNAPISQKLVIDRTLRHNAELYLGLYVRIIEESFSPMRESFEPRTKGEIGFIAEIMLSRQALLMYGFRALKNADKERIEFVPIDATGFKKRSNLAYLHGASALHGCSSANGFKDLDVKREVIENEILPQLSSIVTEGRLNENQCKYLLLERIIAIIAKRYRKHFSITRMDRLSEILPIALDDVESAMRYEIAYRYYEDEMINERRRSGIIKETWKGSQISFSYRLSTEDRHSLDQQAKKAVEERKKIGSSAESVGIKPVRK